MDKLNPREESLLFRLELIAVELGGLIANPEEIVCLSDIEALEKWQKMKFISLRKIQDKELGKEVLILELSKDAWDMAHKYRRLKAERSRYEPNDKMWISC